MLNKDYYILLSMIETIDKIIRYTLAYQSAEELYQNDRDFDTAKDHLLYWKKSGQISVQRKIERIFVELAILNPCSP